MLFGACKSLISSHVSRRTFFGALVSIFNRVSPGRIKLVGPDRACAEWLMRNGAHVRWVGQTDFVAHYDGLPLDENEKGSFHIEEIYAKDASLSHHGFPHLKGCMYIKRMTLIKCSYIDDKCIDSLSHIRETLNILEIRSCHELTRNGLLKLGRLEFPNLTCLILGNLVKPEDLIDVVQILQKCLPNSRVEMVDECG